MNICVTLHEYCLGSNIVHKYCMSSSNNSWIQPELHPCQRAIFFLSLVSNQAWTISAMQCSSIAAKLGAVVTFGTYLKFVRSSNPWDCDIAATGYLHNMLTKTYSSMPNMFHLSAWNSQNWNVALLLDLKTRSYCSFNGMEMLLLIMSYDK